MSVKEIHFCDLCGKQIPEAILIPYDTKYRHRWQYEWQQHLIFHMLNTMKTYARSATKN